MAGRSRTTLIVEALVSGKTRVDLGTIFHRHVQALILKMRTETGPIYLSPFLIHMYRRSGWMTQKEMVLLQPEEDPVVEDSGDEDELEDESEGEDNDE